MNETNYYAVIPTFLLSSKEFTDGEKILCGLIAGFSNINGYCYSSNQKLAQCLNKSENSIKATLKRLYEKGLIDNIGTKKSRKLKLSYIKSMEDLECQNDTLECQIDTSKENSDTLECQNDTLECQIDTSYYIDINKNKYNVQGHVQKNLDDTLSFENWYKIYPRKEKRDRAEKAFNKLTKYHKSFLLKATQIHIEHKENLNEIFEHPATFLNSKVFLDYEEEIKQKKEESKKMTLLKEKTTSLVEKIISFTKEYQKNKIKMAEFKTNEGRVIFDEFDREVLKMAEMGTSIFKMKRDDIYNCLVGAVNYTLQNKGRTIC